MPVVSTIPERCRRCYTCIRECPAKAIRVKNGQAWVIAERCIACGNCVKVCAQKAKQIDDARPIVRRLLANGKPTIACLAPSFPAAFDQVPPDRLIGALRRLGFQEVWEVAFGAELIAREYLKLYKRAKRTGEPVIATCCPAIVSYVEKYLPQLHKNLAPVVSPKLALARAIRKHYNGRVNIVFIGPCIAKKLHLHDPAVEGNLDAVMTFEELQWMLDAASVDPTAANPSGFDGPRAYFGRALPLSGGLLRASGLSTDILENDIVVAEGKEHVLMTLREIADGRSKALFYDLLFCEGCIDGPKMLNHLSTLARREIMTSYVNEQNRYTTQRDLAEGLAMFSGVDLNREFLPENQVLPMPAEDAIERVLESMHKSRPQDRLNCGACGYESCREKAIAVCQGFAEVEMCLPYVVDELEGTCQSLRDSHAQLETTQRQLLQTERLASMGQLSAGVAHELNNPLGTILLYSHMLLKALGASEQKGDLQMIVSEAMRCKDIVRGLLDFARQSRVTKAPTDIGELVQEVANIAQPRATELGITVRGEVGPNLPVMMVDRMQLRQGLVNLVNNAVDASTSGGSVVIGAAATKSGRDLMIEVQDQGCGIARENLSKVFTPFFTTKENGKGTGLGLAITYGVIKMHSGDITVDSEVGHGTRFTIRLPVQTAEEALAVNGKEYKVEDRFFR